MAGSSRDELTPTPWAGWARVPKNDDREAVSGPSACLIDNRLAIMFRAADDSIYWNQTDGSEWKGLDPIPGSTTKHGPTAAFQQVFIHGIDGSVRHSERAGNGWGEFYPLKPHPVGIASTIGYGHGDGQTRMALCADIHNDVWFSTAPLKQEPMKTDDWTTWQSLPGGEKTKSGPSSYDVYSGGPGMTAFIRGLTNEILFQEFKGGKWSGQWQTPGTVGRTISEIRWVQGHHKNILAIAGEDFNVWNCCFFGAQSAPWRPIIDPKFKLETHFAPAVYMFDSRVYVFATHTDGMIYHNWVPIKDYHCQ